MGQPHTLRKLNRRQVVQALLDAPALTRPQLAEALGLSKVTVAAIVQELLEHRAVQLSAQPSSGIGRTPQSVQLLPDLGTAVALDLQTHSIQARCLPLQGAPGPLMSRAAAPQQVVQAAAELITELHASAPFGPLSTVAISVPAPVDASGRVGEPNALAAFDASPIRTVAHHLQLDVLFENDANLVALALSAAYPQGTTLAAVIERPSGIGMGLILEGELYRGPRGRAGELGNAPWPTARGATCVEQLPVYQRLEAAAYSLAGLAIGLDLDALLLAFEHAEELATRLGPLLAPGVTLRVVPEAADAPLRGAELLARQQARLRFLERLDQLEGRSADVA